MHYVFIFIVYLFCAGPCLTEKGFCILGESCPYDHGLDPVVIGGSGLSPYGHPPPGMAGIAVPTLPPPPPPPSSQG